MEKRKLSTIVVVVVLIILGYFGYQFFWPSSQEEIVDDQLVEELNPFNQEESKNPLEGSSNPYADIKTNPFE